MKTPAPMKPERLRELSDKATAGTLTAKDKEELILGHTRLAQAIARRFTRYGKHLAEELEAEALLSVVEAVNNCQGLVLNLYQWISTAIRNKLCKLITREKSTDPLSDKLTTPDTLPLEEELEDVCRDEDDRLILQRRLDGQSDRQIAQEMELSETAIRARRHQMQRRFSRHED